MGIMSVEPIKRWRQTQMGPAQRHEVLTLSTHIKSALQAGRIAEAQAYAVRMHSLSQDHAGLHVYGHWLSAKVCLKAGQKRPALRHLYLTIMAPYGTVRRRLKAS